MRVLRLALVLGGIASAAALATPSPGSAPVSCAGSVVRYTRTAIGTPWTARGPVTANIFYYTGATLMDGRINGVDGLRIYAGGKAPDGATMKILWTVASRRAGGSLALTARRIDGRGLVERVFPPAGGGQFPSIVNLPAAGCWRVSVRTGSARATFVVRAIQPPPMARCQPTRLEDGKAWVRPRSAGIYGGWGPWTTADGSALLYTHGIAPGDVNTKVPWWVVRPGASSLLTLDGGRLDARGEFRQQFSEAQSPPDVYPSTVVVPAAGCWALRLRTGALAGLIVVRAVDR